MTGLIGQGQISDAKITDTIALWIVPNLTKSITAAQMNAILDHLNNSKINKDSIVNVRTNAAEDSLFIKYKKTLDTIVLLHELDNLSDVVLTTPDASDMLILDDETMKWVNRPLIQVYGDMLDTANKAPTNFDTWKRDTTNGELYTCIQSDANVSAYKDSSDYIAQLSPKFTGSLTVWLKDFINANKYDLFDNTPINNASIVFIGDSEVEPYANGLKKLFDDKFGDAGHGYITMLERAVSQTENIPLTLIGNSWSFNATHSDTLGLHGNYAENTDNDSAILITSGYFNKLRFHYMQISGGGEFQWKVNYDGDTSTAISTDGATSAIMTAEIDAGGDFTPADTLYIFSNSGTVRLYGVVMMKKYPSGLKTYPIEVHRIYRGGSTYPKWNKQHSEGWNVLDSLAPSLIFINFLENTMTINDTYYAMADSMVSNIRTVRDSIESDIVITSIQPSVGAYAHQQRIYNHRLSKDNDIGHYDFFQKAGDWSVLNSLGVLSTNHLKYEGVYMTALDLFDLLIPNGYTEKEKYYLEIPATVNADTGTIKQNGSVIWQRYGTNNFISNSGNYTTTGDFNIGIGNLALSGISSGDYHVAIGVNASFRQNIQSYIVSIGRNTGMYNTGASNVFLGAFAATGVDGSSTAQQVVAVGYEAAKTITTGNYGTYVGYQAGGGATLTGESNVALGNSAGFGLTSGKRNTLIGTNSGKVISSGQYNTIIGFNAGDAANSSSNSILGYMAGTSLTSGGTNTFIGATSGYTNTTGTGNVFIGNAAGYNETGSYKTYIAADSTSWANGMASGSKLLMYADMSNAAKSNHFINLFGKVSIGAAKNPTEMLSVTGNASITGYLKTGTGSIADNDSTPSVASYNTFIYAGSANPVSIDALDDHVVGCYYTIIGNSNTYTITVIDGTPSGGDSFNLAGGNWVGGSQDVLLLYCIAADAFVEVSRSDN